MPTRSSLPRCEGLSRDWWGDPRAPARRLGLSSDECAGEAAGDEKLLGPAVGVVGVPGWVVAEAERAGLEVLMDRASVTGTLRLGEPAL